MKRFLFVLALVGVWGVAGRGLEAQAQPLSFGIRAGLNTGVYNFDDVRLATGTIASVADRSNGYQAGVIMRISLPVFLYVQTELDVAMRDYDFAIKPLGEGKTTYKSVRTTRIEVPLLVGFRVAGARFFCGPVWHIHSQQRSGQGTSYDLLEVTFDENNLAATIGAAIDFNRLFVEIRYQGYLKQTHSRVKLAGTKGSINVEHDQLLQLSFGMMF